MKPAICTARPSASARTAMAARCLNYRRSGAEAFITRIRSRVGRVQPARHLSKVEIRARGQKRGGDSALGVYTCVLPRIDARNALPCGRAACRHETDHSIVAGADGIAAFEFERHSPRRPEDPPYAGIAAAVFVIEMAKRQQSDRLFRQVGRHGADSQSLKVPIVVAFRAVVVRDQMNADRAEGWECLRI